MAEDNRDPLSKLDEAVDTGVRESLREIDELRSEHDKIVRKISQVRELMQILWQWSNEMQQAENTLESFQRDLQQIINRYNVIFSPKDPETWWLVFMTGARRENEIKNRLFQEWLEADKERIFKIITDFYNNVWTFANRKETAFRDEQNKWGEFYRAMQAWDDKIKQIYSWTDVVMSTCLVLGNSETLEKFIEQLSAYIQSIVFWKFKEKKLAGLVSKEEELYSNFYVKRDEYTKANSELKSFDNIDDLVKLYEFSLNEIQGIIDRLHENYPWFSRAIIRADFRWIAYEAERKGFNNWTSDILSAIKKVIPWPNFTSFSWKHSKDKD